jgi:DNA topoisomerase-1
MSNALIIVESPAKVKTITKILGSAYKVEASIGHIRDLPKKGLGVDEKHDFAPQYEIISGKDKVVKALRQAAGKLPASEGDSAVDKVVQIWILK